MTCKTEATTSTTTRFCYKHKIPFYFSDSTISIPHLIFTLTQKPLLIKCILISEHVNLGPIHLPVRYPDIGPHLPSPWPITFVSQDVETEIEWQPLISLTVGEDSVREKRKDLKVICPTSAISSADGSELSLNHMKKVLGGPCRLFLLCPFCADCAFFMRSIPSFQFKLVDVDAGSPTI